MVLCAAVLWWCHEASPTWMALRFFGKLKAFKVKAIALKYIKIIKISKKDTINFGCSSKAPRRLGSLSLRPWIRTSCSMEHLRSFGLSVANILLVYDTFMIPQYSCFDDNVRIFPPLQKWTRTITMIGISEMLVNDWTLVDSLGQRDWHIKHAFFNP